MAKRRDKSENVAEGTAPAPTTTQVTGRHRPDGESARARVTSATGMLATLVAIAATVVCVLLALHIAFAVFSANPANPIVRTVNSWARWFAWQFHDMFTPKDARVAVLVNYGIAAIVYLIVGRFVAGLIRRIR